MKRGVLALLLAVVLFGTFLSGCAAKETDTTATGTKEIPSINYLYNQTDLHATIATTLQDMLKTDLGITFNIEVQEWAVLQTNRTEGNYQMARHGWLGDYIDPMTFLDLFVANSGQNDPRFRNEEYDALIAKAKSNTDQNVRMQAMHDAEKLLMDSFGLIPIFHYTNTWLASETVKNSVFDPLLGNSFFMWASKDGGGPINYGIGASPKTLDPQLNNATDGATHVQSCFEGLTRKNANNEVEPGIATNWDVSEDGLTWTFHLRDAKWSDGEPVKAQDFVYAWQRAVDPASECEYSYQLWYVKNGESISDGEMDKSELGVTAIDDKTLEVTLENICGYFTQLTAFPTLYPVREDIVSANPGWANSADTYICNGPYKITKFVPNDQINFVKNDQYWDSANYPCPDLNVFLTDDASAMLAAFETGEMDIVEECPNGEIKRMKDQGSFKVAPLVGTYYLAINLDPEKQTNEALLDVNVRKAIALAIDRAYIIELANNEALEAFSFVPPGVPDADGTDFKDNAPNYFGSGDHEKDLQEAKDLLNEAGYKVP